MADYVTGVKTNQGEKKIDYNYLANKLKTKDGSEDGYLISAGDKEKLDNTASNDALINLQNELDAKIDENTSAVNGLAGTVNGLAGTVNGLAGTVNELTGTVNGLTGTVNELTGTVNGLTGTVNELAQRDYVVQQGESVVDNITWTYRKWNSGVSECWGRYSREFNKETKPLPISPSDDVTGVYYLSADLFAKYPTGLFLDIPKCIASYVGLTKGPLKKSQRATTYASFLYTKEQPTASETGIYSIYRIGAIPSSDLNDEIIKWYVYIDFHVIGKWKELK